MRAAATDRGISIEYDKRLVAVSERLGEVAVRFADGSTAAGDLLVGVDGLHSRTRKC